MHDGFELEVIALVDTGSEVNLIRRNLIPDKYLLPPREKVLLKAANQTGLGAGHREVRGNLVVEGFDIDSKSNTSVTLTIDAYDADIDVDVLLSYEWLATMDVDVRSQRHGIIIHQSHAAYWVPGLKKGLKVGEVPLSVLMVNQTTSPPELHENSDPDIEVPNEADEYTVRQEFFQEFTRRLKIRPTRDCFACPGENHCPQYWTAKEDALNQVWGPEEILWINPPGVYGHKLPKRF